VIVIVAVLFTLFLVALVVLGLGLAATLGVIALVLLFRAASRKGGRRRGIVFLLAGMGFLVLAAACLIPTWALGSRILPPLFEDYKRMNAEKRERPTLDPALEDVRDFVKAEAAYQSANGGFFDKPDCLARPRECIPGYAGGPFLDAAKASPAARGGFLWSFHPGGSAVPSNPMERVSPSSLSSYAWVGVPSDPRENARSVCGDASGQVCTFVGRQLAAPAACPPDCIRHTWSDD
jgi:hypothetical protein